MDLGEGLRQRLVRGHGEHRAGDRDEGRLEARGRRGEDRDEEQDAERGAHDRAREGGEDVVGGLRVGEPEALLAGADDHLRGDAGGEVRGDEHDHRDERGAAGVFALPVVSSLVAMQASQPQYMKIESERPAVKAAKDWTAKGFIQDQEKETEVSKSPAFDSAIATKTTRTTSWRPTRAYWMPLVAVMPR